MSRILAAGIASALIAFVAFAQTTVTESDLLSVLTPAHPAVAAAVEDLALARAALIDAEALENPSIGIVREDPRGPAAQTDLMVSWQLPDLARASRARARRKEVEAAEARLAHALLRLRLEMQEIYAAWALAAAQHDRLSRQLTRVGELAARERLRAERGESSGLEAQRLALAANALRARVAIAAAGAQERSAIARSWNPDLPPDARPALPDLPPPPATSERHPLLVAAEADVDAAIAAQRAAGRVLESPELMAGWQQQKTGEETLPGPLIGVNWSVPLFRRNQAERVAAAGRLAAARARLEQTRRELAARQQAAAETYRRLAAEVATLEAAAIETEAMLRAAEAAFIHGEATVTDLLETWRSATEAEVAVLELRQAALAALREHQRFTIPSSEIIEKEIQP
ncbi:MAG TPA: TolC family protein [Thermoanaerobaculia bacterium]|nr:TolC family protein [Thermoanaerobaculia bacterium]